ncbi:MAG: hypothetical protein CL573_04620 [Alphaproteobacteria bacterium]|nr:hypothetical protein [Alphaproteobacteria bacterium]HCP00710.1 DUF192 domain-containing protein [Rhodospirillaceae bacterium]
MVATYPALADAEIEFSRSSLRIETADAVHIFDVEVATNDEQRSRGLMFRNELAPSAGMIFLYKRDRLLTMWMANTYLPLDMLFIGGDGNIVHIVENAIPLSRAMISSRRRARAVLEVNAGTVSRLEIKVGDRVFHDGLTAPYP